MAECLVKAFQREMLEADNQYSAGSKIKGFSYDRVVYTMGVYTYYYIGARNLQMPAKIQ